MRIFHTIVVLLLLIAGAAGGYWYYTQQQPTITADQPAPSPSPQPTTLPQFTITAVQTTDTGRRLITCQPRPDQPQKARCRSLEHQRNESEAVTDGQFWYYYQVQDKKIRLVRQHIASGKTTTIIEQTPLASPRGLIVSPDNRKIVYWLDNIDEPKKQLTELWFYDADTGGTQLVAEKIYRPAVLTQPRFNRAGTVLWFIGDASKPGENSKPELLIAAVKPVGLAARHLHVDWGALQTLVARGVMDISPDGSAAAFADRVLNRTRFTISREPEEQTAALAGGDIVYLHWRDNQTLTYVLQERDYFSFWETSGGLHRQLSRYPGQIESIRGPADGSYFVFAVREGMRTNAVALETDSHRLTPLFPLPAFGKRTYIVQALQQDPDGATPGITAELDDGQLAAFIDKHIGDIAQNPAAKPQRLIITGQSNTLLVDYRDEAGEAHRFLLTVRDAVNAEWSILARYRAAGAEWVRETGSSQEAPKPLRLYEWEPDPGQWILKEEYGAK